MGNPERGTLNLGTPANNTDQLAQESPCRQTCFSAIYKRMEEDEWRFILRLTTRNIYRSKNLKSLNG